jgi:hypothetical protein
MTRNGVGSSLSVIPCATQRDDAAMRERCEHARLFGEARSELSSGAHKDVQSHGRPGLPIVRAVDGSHAAHASEPFDLESFANDGTRLHRPSVYAPTASVPV